MSKGELKFVLEILHTLYTHFVKTPHSLIARLYGIFEVKIPNYEPVILMLMANTLRYKDPKNITRVYDLKGSSINREVKMIYKPSTVLKDTNLLKNAKFCGQEISLDTDDRKILLETLKADSEMLASLGIMDYSLLVGIEHDSSQLEKLIKKKMRKALGMKMKIVIDDADDLVRF